MSRPRILVAMPVFDEVLARLGEVFEVDAPCGSDDYIEWTHEALVARLQGCVGVAVASSPRIDAALLAACPDLRVVASMAVGSTTSTWRRARRAGCW